MWGFRYSRATLNGRLTRTKAPYIIYMFSFVAFTFFSPPVFAQDIGPSVVRSNKQYYPFELKEFEVAKSGYNLGVAPLVNTPTGNLGNYYSPGPGAEFSVQFINENEWFYSFGIRLSFNRTLKDILPADSFPQMNIAPLGSFSLGGGKRFKKFYFEGIAHLAFFSIREKVPDNNDEDIPAENLNSAMFGAKISYPLKAVLGSPKVVFNYDEAPHYTETRMNLWLAYYHGFLFNKEGFHGGVLELGLTFQFNRYELKSYKL